MSELLKHVSNKLEFTIKSIKPLSGGDISEVLHIKSTHKNYVIKINSKEKYSMFQSEAIGLNQLKKSSKIIRIPAIYDFDVFRDQSYLLMEYIQPGKSNKNSHQLLGKGLAEIHQNTQECFGAKNDNFIGSLAQSNQLKENWSKFYWEERILPQLKLAVNKNYYQESQLPTKEKAISVFKEFFITHPPALLHGDLWNGNYFFDQEAVPVLIDPSVYYGHPAMDIGMAKLFGGFNEAFFNTYKKNNDLGAHLEEQIKLAQLYYLLVHLNLFGKSYYAPVNNILNQFLK